MATATITGNVVNVDVEGTWPLRLGMSLQRHSYRHCGSSPAAVALNSLFHASVADATILAEAVEVGEFVEGLLRKSSGRWADLFGKDLTVRSGRTYLVDNSALNPNGSPNHFFITGGTGVWARISQADYLAARDLRRVEDELSTRRLRGDTYDYVDPKALHAKSREEGGADNPVVRAVNAARVSLAAGSRDHAPLIAASGRADLVALVRG
ncbi:hypothetical protein ACFXB3_36330 [Streptomyces sp. NPDC059447]|uniref:hypothetical protein n=1 Tax=Streptomyces sp. NPDC059447 TaxID=3346834 RepID=UPI00368D953B